MESLVAIPSQNFSPYHHLTNFHKLLEKGMAHTFATCGKVTLQAPSDPTTLLPLTSQETSESRTGSSRQGVGNKHSYEDETMPEFPGAKVFRVRNEVETTADSCQEM